MAVPIQKVPPSRLRMPVDFRKITKKFISTTMISDDVQPIFLSGVHLEVFFSRFILHYLV